ncbi:Gfo/Idh/MocA family oxidoreductase [Labedaea rhizosphaerae]|uniref:Putative dehydrogenase n=1 Tax=Labedaea rhizosphaerae TaxID=598644 RepID=A0A4R6RSI0_LABRH|nr:Gfo/Idh/MocA family oxidoreductase [Labedaea rhizosphaerae]TDP89215.1 putative dehydrogenase [Labedaea rhizosphaerae]
MTDDKRVAVLGYGLAGSAFHAPYIEATPGLRVATVVTGNPERQAAARERYPDAAVVSTMEDMLAAGPDLVVVATPNRHHVANATEALRRGISVVVDKPVAGTPDEVATLGELAEDQGVMFTVFQNRRWDGDFRTVRDLVDTARLPDVSAFESRFERVGRPGARSAWKTSTDPLDLAHIVYDLGSHLLDQAIVLFGPVESVFGRASSPRPDVPVEEDVTLAVRHVSGVSTLLRMSNAVQPAGPRFTVTGATAGYRCWGLDPQERAARSGARPTDPGFGVYDEAQWGSLITDEGRAVVPTLNGDYLGYWSMVEACLRGDGPPPVLPEESIRLVTTVAAAMRAVRDGRPVVL